MTLHAQLEDAQREIRHLEDEVDRLKRQAKPRIDIPPAWVIKAARSALKRTNYWNEAYTVLSAYYGVPEVKNLCNDDRVPKGAAACYYAFEKTVYGKKKGMNTWTAMHEFAHHLCASLIPIGGEAEQAFCDEFSTAIEEEVPA